MSHLIKNETSRERVRGEIRESISKLESQDVMNIPISELTSSQFTFLNQVINESLRYNPPSPFGAEYKILKDCKLGQYEFKKGTLFNPCLYQAHRNPNQWHHPEKFLPERFDPSSELFTTPSGEQRSSMSFIPFSFGERKRLGYQFAKVIIPSMITKMIHGMEFEFTDKELYK